MKSRVPLLVKISETEKFKFVYSLFLATTVTILMFEKFKFVHTLFLATTVTILMFCSYIFIYQLFFREGRADEAW